MREDLPTTLVLGKDGLRGHIQADPGSSETENGQVLVQLENGQQVLVSQQLLRLQDDGSYFLPLNADELVQAYSRHPQQSEPGLVVPVIQEALEVEKRWVETGRVCLTKTVQEHQETVDEPLLREEVTMERVAVNTLWDGPAPGVRQEGQTLIVPVLEEVLVVEKRLLLKEELHITKRQTTVHAPQTVTLRCETVQVERIDPTAPDKQNDVLRSPPEDRLTAPVDQAR